MKYFSNILCVTYRELTRCDDGEPIMSKSNYDLLKYRGRINAVSAGRGMGNEALVEWSSMPERFRERYVAKYGDQERAVTKAMNQELKIDESARSYYQEYTLPDGVTRLKSDQIEAYTLDASVLALLNERWADQKSGRGSGGNNTPVNWAPIFALSDDLREAYGHHLPKSRSRLQDKMREFRASGYACLISGKIGNSNTAKMTAESQEWAVMMMRRRSPRYTEQMCFTAYNEEAASGRWKPLKSSATLHDYLWRPDVYPLWADTKIGELAVRQKLQHQNTLKAVGLRDSLWYGDGTVINLYYKEFSPSQGRYVARRVWVYEVMDAATEVLLGCAIGKVENFDLARKAILNALEFSGHKPYELAVDNQGGVKAKQNAMWMSRIANIYRNTAPHHGNSKTVESMFGRFQAQVLSRCYNYSGGNVKALSHNAQIDTEFIRNNVESLPTFDGLIAQYMNARNEWNRMPMAGACTSTASRLEVYNGTENPNTSAVTPEMLSRLRMVFSKAPSTYRQGGIRLTVDKREYWFEVRMEGSLQADRRWATEHMDEKFVVEYDPDSLTGDGSFIRLHRDCGAAGLQEVAVARPKHIVARDMLSQSPEDKRFLQESIRLDKEERVRLQLERLAIDARHGILPERMGMVTPKLQGMGSAEFERIAERIRREQVDDDTGNAAVPSPLPASPGLEQKELSAADRLDEIYSRM